MKYFLVFCPKNAEENTYSDSIHLYKKMGSHVLSVASFDDSAAIEAVIACDKLNNSHLAEDERLPF